MEHTPAMVPEERLEQITRRFQYLEAAMADGRDDIVALAREYSGLRPVVESIATWRRLRRDIADARTLLADPDMRDLAEAEVETLKAQLSQAEQALLLELVPRDEADRRPAIVEIRPGTGGEEAALFAADLCRMYQRYAEAKGWTVSILSASETGLGGYKELILDISGQGVYARLKFESGVHRVQRVPETEGGGRIHTSAATVAWPA